MDNLRIKVDDMVRLFGSKAKVARVFKITPQALTNWGDYVPELRVYKFREAHPEKAEFLLALSKNTGRKQANAN